MGRWRDMSFGCLLMLASCFTLALCQRQLAQDSDENSALLRYVSTGKDFLEAVDLGVKHVVITEHLNLSPFSRALYTLTRGVVETSTTATIQGMCEGTPAPRTDTQLPSSRACVLDIHEDFLEASNTTQVLALAHLYVRLRKPLVAARSSGTLLLQRSPAVFLSRVVLEGDGLVVRGVDSYENTRLYVQHSSFSNFARNFGSAIKLRANVTATVVSSRFVNNTIIPERDRPQNYGPDLYVGAASTVLLHNVTFSDKGRAPKDAARAACVAKLHGRAHVYAHNAPGGGEERSVDVFNVEEQKLQKAEPGPAGAALAEFPRSQDPWLTATMKEWSSLVQQNPFLRPPPGDDSAASESGAAGDGGGSSGGGGSVVVVGDGSDAVEVPHWVIIVAAVALFFVLCALAAVVLLCMRNRNVTQDQKMSRQSVYSRKRNAGSAALHDISAGTSQDHIRTGLNTGPHDGHQSERSSTWISMSLQSIGSGTATGQLHPSMQRTSASLTATPATSPSPLPMLGPDRLTPPAATATPRPTHNSQSNGIDCSPMTSQGEPYTGAETTDQPVRSASTSSSILDSVPIPSPVDDSAQAASSHSAEASASANTQGGSNAVDTAHRAPPVDPEELKNILEEVARSKHPFLGRYELEGGEVRTGPQGVVVFGRCRVSGDPVAIKFFLNSGRFMRDEALYMQSSLRPLMQAAISMHGNLDGLNALGTFAFPPCTVMKRGMNLKEWMRVPGGRKYADVCLLLLQLATWLDVAHKTGFAHRNVKPSNIIVLGPTNTMTVVDFGCAARIGTKTAHGKSLRYLPPEAVAAAESHKTTVPSDPAADMWAFGAIAYEIVSGKPIFPSSVAAADVKATLVGKATLPWESSSGEYIGGSFRKFGGLRRAVKWCLSRDPSMRPPAHALVAEITARMHSGSASLPTPPSLPSVVSGSSAGVNGSGQKAGKARGWKNGGQK